MKKIWVIIKREYLALVKTRGFLIGTFLVPLLILILAFLPAVFMNVGTEGEKTIAVIDFTRRLYMPLQHYLAEMQAENPDQSVYRIQEILTDSSAMESQKAALNAQVLSGSLDAFLIFPEDIFENNQFELYAKNISNFQFNETLAGRVTRVVSGLRLREIGLDPELVQKMNRSVRPKTYKVDRRGAKEESGEITFGISYIMVFMIYLALIFYGVFVMRGVIEDKNSRMAEILLSSVRPHQLMAGKILGIGATGMTQLGIWGFTLLLVSTYGLIMIRQFVPAVEKMPFPTISIWVIVGFIVFFLMGFFLYSTIYAALGSMGNSESEMQNLQWPAMSFIVVAFMLMFAVIKNPDGPMAVALSLFPFFSPILMFLRISLHAVPFYQVLLCIVLCLVTLAGMVWITGRIYRVGILMYGKRPSLPELMKWIRYS
ncbi:ABC transporter permease [bacterium]|nr:ABC transporter permease [bacterium]